MILSNPTCFLKLPFPFVEHVLPVDRFIIEAGHFNYMGRECFPRLVVEVEKLNLQNGYRKLYIRGTIGYGKSHLMAALACYLSKQGKAVIYIPDCRAMLDNYVEYLRSAMLMGLAGAPKLQEEVVSCDGAKDLVRLAQDMARRNPPVVLYFLIDQVNALECADFSKNRDNIPDELKVQVRGTLDNMASSHIRILSASANYESYKFVYQKQQTEIRIELYGGLSEVRRYTNMLYSPLC
jgi:hypothetical protein